jgi:RHS repeat-associated protein
VSAYSYDAIGNLIQSTDRNGQVRTFAYDALNRRTSETWLDGGGLPVNMFAYSFDSVGNLQEVGDNTSHYSFAYDALNRVTGTDNAGTVGLPHVVLSYGYDAVGNRTSVEDNSRVRVDSVYDPRNLLTSRRWSGGGIDPARIDVLYNLRGERTETRRFSDLDALNQIGRSTYSYNSKGLGTAINHRDATDAVLADFDYVRDLADQILEWTHHGQTTTYTHDAAGQLTSADHTTQPDETYSYDLSGNRTGSGYVTGPNNQLLADDTFNYAYDNEGNLILKIERATGERTEYVYDHRNRLVSVTVKSSGGIILQESTYRYDALDRRIGKTVDTDGAGPQSAVTLHTVYDGEHAWADFEGAGAVSARYLFGDRMDEIVARWQPTIGTAWYLTDHLGTIHDLTDAAGVLSNSVTYDSFGLILAQTNLTFSDRFTFTGREFDTETGLYYFRARFYNPKIGRFISQDEIGFLSGDVNLQRYVRNAPHLATNPRGNSAVLEWFARTDVQLALAVGCTFTEVALDKNKDWGSAAFSAFVGIGAGKLFGSGLAYSLVSKSLALRVLGATLGVGLGATGLGFAAYGVYDAYREWQNGNKTFGSFVTRLTCTSLDFVVLVAAARATAKSLANAFKPFPRGSFDLPTPRISAHDDFGVRVEWPGSPAPTVRFEFDGTTVVVTDIFRRSNPSGSAGQMIADALRLIGRAKPSSLRFASIIEESTVTLLNSGRDAAETVLGKTLQNAVEEIGARISGWSVGTTKGKPWIQVALSYI